MENAKIPFKSLKLDKTTNTIILGRLHFEEGLYASGKIECTEKCALMHIFLCIRGPEQLKIENLKNRSGPATTAESDCWRQGGELTST